MAITIIHLWFGRTVPPSLWKAFCFVDPFLFCFPKLYANWCLHVSEMATSLLIDSPTTLHHRAGRHPAFRSLYTSHNLALARDPFKGQWDASYFPSWHLHERCNISPLGEGLLRGNWEFASLSNSHNHQVSGLKENEEAETKRWNKSPLVHQ